jgi:hypothetical protein
MPAVIHLLCTRFTRRVAGHLEVHSESHAAYPLDDGHTAYSIRDFYRHAHTASTEHQHVPQRTVASASATTTNPGTYSRTKLAILCSHVFVPVSVMRVESRAWHPKQAAQEGRLAEEL